MIEKKRIKWLFLLPILFLLIQSCNGPNDGAFGTPTSVNINLIATLKPHPTLEITSSPTTRVDPTTSPTYQPTLTIIEKENIIDQLLSDDYRCDLPCFAGINPGVTSWSETDDYFSNLSDNPVYNPTAGNYVFEIKRSSETTLVFFYTKKGLTDFLMVPRLKFPISKLLAKYGQPDEIYFYVVDVLPVDQIVPYTIYLFYKRGFVVQYTGASGKGSILKACLNNKENINNGTAFIWSWNGISNASFENIIKNYESKFYPADATLTYFRLGELSKFDLHSFFETYRNETSTECLELRNPNISR